MPSHLAVAGQSNSPISSYENAPGGAGGFIVRRNRGLRSGNTGEVAYSDTGYSDTV